MVHLIETLSFCVTLLGMLFIYRTKISNQDDATGDVIGFSILAIVAVASLICIAISHGG